MAASEVHVVVLAAGQGTRMKSRLPKVLHSLAGRPLVEHVLKTADAISPSTITLIVGHSADIVRSTIGSRPNLGFVVQEPQLGTAHALQQAEARLAGREGTLVLLSGDVPLLSGSTLRRLIETHQGAKAAATVVTAVVERPYGYGRIVRTKGRIARRFARSTAGSMPSTSRRYLRRCAVSRRRTLRASTTSPT